MKTRTYKWQKDFKGLNGKRDRCGWKGCGVEAAGTGRLCHRHKNGLYRLGHPDARIIRRGSYHRFIKPALDYILTSQDKYDTRMALDALDRALSPAFVPTDPRYAKVTQALVRLRDYTARDGRKHTAPVTMPEALAEMCAMFLYWSRTRNLEGVYWILATRAILRLKPRAMKGSMINPQTFKQEGQYDCGLSAKALKLVADRLSDAVKLFVVGYAHHLDEQKQHAEKMRLALAGHSTVEEERDAQLEDARQRAAALKRPKRTDPNATPVDSIPAHFNHEERQQFIALHEAAEKRRLEALAS